MSQNNYVVRVLDRLREPDQFSMSDDEFLDDAVFLAFVPIDLPKIDHQQFELTAQMERDTNKHPLRATISGVRDEQLDHLVQRNECILQIGNSFEDAGRRKVGRSFVGGQNGQKSQHVQDESEEAGIKQRQRDRSRHARVLDHDLARSRVLDAAPVPNGVGYVDGESGPLQPQKNKFDDHQHRTRGHHVGVNRILGGVFAGEVDFHQERRRENNLK